MLLLVKIASCLCAAQWKLEAFTTNTSQSYKQGAKDKRTAPKLWCCVVPIELNGNNSSSSERESYLYWQSISPQVCGADLMLQTCSSSYPEIPAKGKCGFVPKCQVLTCFGDFWMQANCSLVWCCWLQVQNLKRGDQLCKGHSIFGGLCLFQSKCFNFKRELRRSSSYQTGVYTLWQIQLGFTDWPESSSERYYVLKLILSKPLQNVSKFSETIFPQNPLRDL